MEALAELDRLGKPVRYQKEYIRKDGRRVPIELFVHAVQNESGQVQLYYAFVTDITERKQAEDKIRAALEEKEALLREVHHRVKNNLQAMVSLLELQAAQVHDAGTVQFLKELEEQARTMSLVYERLYQSESLAHIDMASYLQELAFNALQAFGGGHAIQMGLNVVPVSLSMELAMPCGLIVNELVTNALKHAFPPGFRGQPAIHIALQLAGEAYRLAISDNGAGLPPGLDWRASRTLGLRLVNLWATHQLGGTLDVTSGPGTSYEVTFCR